MTHRSRWAFSHLARVAAAVAAVAVFGAGSLLAQGLCVGVRGTAGNFTQGLATLTVTPMIVILCLFVALVIGLVSSFVPAWGASRTSILDALRYSG